MMYYRIAAQVATPPTWRWKSTVLSELSALLKVLRPYLVLPPERVRVFVSSSREDLDEQVERANTDLRSSSLTASQFLQKQGFSSSEWERDRSAGGNAENQATTVNALTVPRKPAEHGGEAQEQDAGFGWRLQRRRTELEQGAGGDHDLPYRFSFPTWMPQAVAWARLVTKVQSGVLQP